MKYTVLELSSSLGLDYVDGRGFIKVMEKLGKAREIEKLKNKTGKGKPTTVYELDQDVCDLLTGKLVVKTSNEIEDLSGVVE